MGLALRWMSVLLLGGLAGAAGALALARGLAPEAADLPALLDVLRGADPLVLALAAAAPLVATILGAALMMMGRSAGAVATAPVEESSETSGRAGDEALTLLALLQQAGRFVDFVEEDLAEYSDAQVGSAVRAIHEGCRTVLRERLEVAPILDGEEGATVTVEAGFDPAAVRLTGNVRGEPPYQGVLRHPGWRSSALRLPESARERDTSILAPAEVEVP